MTLVLALKRRHEPDAPDGALAFFTLIAASGFVVGWAAQMFGGF
jgi:hypothetical protein